MSQKRIYIIAGSNGAGKTTASFTILPEILGCKEFVNADEIARGLSPFNPERVAIQAGKLMINRIYELLELGETFALETTLATKNYKQLILKAQQQNYEVALLFFWLKRPEIAKERVKIRVEQGGHNIPSQTIERRYFRGIDNLFSIYLPIVDKCFIFDNSEGEAELIAEKISLKIKILNEEKYNQLIKYNNGNKRQ